MNDLKQLVSLVSQEKLQPVTTISEKMIRSKKLRMLYEGIRDGVFTTDADAAKAIQNCRPSDKKYYMLRKKLFKCLVETLSVSDYSCYFTTVRSDEIYIRQNLIAVRSLLSAFRRESANIVSESILEVAERYDFTDIRVACLRDLRESASMAGREEEFEALDRKLMDAIELHQKEIYSESLLLRIESKRAGKFGDYENIMALAKEFLQYVEGIITERKSYTLELNYYRILFLHLQSTRDFHEVLTKYEDMQNFFNRYSHMITNSRRAEFSIIAMNASFRLRDFRGALVHARFSNSAYPTGTGNWFTAKFRFALMLLCNNIFSEAHDEFITAVNSEFFPELSDNDQDKWIILGCYIGILDNASEFDLELIQNGKVKKALTVLKSPTTFLPKSKDVSGLNIAMKIMQIVNSIFYREYIFAHERHVQLKRYIAKYKLEEKYGRTRIFIDLLQLLLQVRLRQDTLERESEKLLLAMQNSNTDDIEVIPYDLLWEKLKTYYSRNH